MDETNTGGAGTATAPAKLHITKKDDEFVLTDGQYNVPLAPRGYIPEGVLEQWVNTINLALKVATTNRS